MIKAEEIRIGNYVLWNNKPKQVTITMLHSMASGVGIPNAIPLTPAILEKCGFEKWYEPDTLGIDAWQKGYEGQRFDLMYEYEMLYMKCRYVQFNKLHQSMPDIKYLHQLQNLFWCLSGTELTITL